MCGCSNHINGCVGAHCTCEGNCKECQQTREIIDESYKEEPEYMWSKVKNSAKALMTPFKDMYVYEFF